MSETPYRLGDARGARFADVPEHVERDLVRWTLDRDGSGLTAIKRGSVYRGGPWLIKFSGPRRRARDLWRPSPALRTARLSVQLGAVRTPKPLLALEWRRGPYVEESVYVCEFVEGRRLTDIWQRDPAAMRAFSTFVAQMHRARVFHGDFHALNSLWNGSEWVLIDLDAVRRGLHVLRRRALAEAQWARVYRGLNFDDGVRAVFDDYLRETGFAWPAEATWRAISARAHAMPSVVARVAPEAP